MRILVNMSVTTKVVHCVLSSLLGPADPSFRALPGRLKFTVRRHKFNQDSLPCHTSGRPLAGKTRGLLPLLLYYSRAFS